MFERLAGPSRTAVEGARDEAARRGDRRIGTDHLLVALLRDERLAVMVGVVPDAARQAVDRLDREALAAIGLALGEVDVAGSRVLNRRTPLTSGAKSVIGRALAMTKAERAREITSRHLMLALFDRPEPDPAAAILAVLVADRPAVRARLEAAV